VRWFRIGQFIWPRVCVTVQTCVQLYISTLAWRHRVDPSNVVLKLTVQKVAALSYFPMKTVSSQPQQFCHNRATFYILRLVISFSLSLLSYLLHLLQIKILLLDLHSSSRCSHGRRSNDGIWIKTNPIGGPTTSYFPLVFSRTVASSNRPILLHTFAA